MTTVQTFIVTLLRTAKHLILDPGAQAVTLYRLGHMLYSAHLPLLPEAIERLGQFATGAYIASSAQIGPRFTIKHSAGIVIGATSIIGSDVTVLHGVTLGSIRFDAQEKRHPTIEDGVLLGAGSIILGPVTIGRCARIGAGAVVKTDVPAHATVTSPSPMVRLAEHCSFSSSGDLDGR